MYMFSKVELRAKNMRQIKELLGTCSRTSWEIHENKKKIQHPHLP